MQIELKSTQVELISGEPFKVSGLIQLHPGTVTVILGDNGTGKSLLLEILQTIADGEPCGRIYSVDWSTISADFEAMRCTQVFQEPRQNFVCRTSADEIILPLLHKDITADAIITRIAELADAADVYGTNMWDRRIDDLSSGEQQKIAICSALAPKPQLMLWDEATARIDDRSFGRIVQLIRETFSEGMLVVATHRPSRYSSFFGDMISSVIEIERKHNQINFIQVSFKGQGADDRDRWNEYFGKAKSVNFTERRLWRSYVDPPEPVSLLFSNGFRCRVYASK